MSSTLKPPAPITPPLRPYEAGKTITRKTGCHACGADVSIAVKIDRLRLHPPVLLCAGCVLAAFELLASTSVSTG